MKHLYIIGNGFDIYTGLATRYADFRIWLENNYPFIYENMQAVYDLDVEWWNDFEVQLGKLDINKYVAKFIPPVKPINEIMAEIESRGEFEQKHGGDMLPNLHIDSCCAKRLRGMLDVLQYCFEKWVYECQRLIRGIKYIYIEKEDSFFINFNYTDVLEMLYKIPEERVLHIHGRSSKHERLIYGHNAFISGETLSNDKEQVIFELRQYFKNPYQQIYKYIELQDKLKTIECVHVYGFSFSEVDEKYMDWIFNNVSPTSHWEISWFSDIDKSRIEKFVLNHCDIKHRLKIIRLEEIAEAEKLA